MLPTQTLKAEHRVIEEMLELTREAAQRLGAGGRVDPAVFRQAADFFRNFADLCHHGKEERHLFARLIGKGLSREVGPVAAMLAEHDIGRGHVRALAAAAGRLEAGEAGAAREVVGQALAYADLLSAHIQKEDLVLFPLADRVLTAGEQAELEKAFEQVETEEMGPGFHERYHGMVAAVRELWKTGARIAQGRLRPARRSLELRVEQTFDGPAGRTRGGEHAGRLPVGYLLSPQGRSRRRRGSLCDPSRAPGGG